MEPHCELVEVGKSERTKLERTMSEEVFIEDKVIIVHVPELSDLKMETSAALKKDNLNLTESNPQGVKRPSKRYQESEKQKNTVQRKKDVAPVEKRAISLTAKLRSYKKPNKQAAVNLEPTDDGSLKPDDVLCETVLADTLLQMEAKEINGCKTYICQHCGYSSVERSIVINHIQTEHEKPINLPFKCKLCSFSCRWSSSLKRHVTTHLDEKPFKCDKCSFSCGQSGHLKMHMTKHSGENKFKCTKCKYSSYHPGHLKTHMTTHSGKRPYQCTECPFTASTSSNLKRHAMCIHTGERPYQCDLCSYGCISASDLKRHWSTHWTAEGKQFKQRTYNRKQNEVKESEEEGKEVETKAKPSKRKKKESVGKKNKRKRKENELKQSTEEEGETEVIPSKVKEKKSNLGKGKRKESKEKQFKMKQTGAAARS